MGILSTLGVIGKIAGAFKALMQWLANRQLIEAGRDKERAEIASQEEKNAEEIRKTQNSVRTPSDADRVLDNILKDLSKK